MHALCHMCYIGHMFNGFPQSVITEQGAGKLDVTHYKNGIFTRAVLIDIPRLKDLPYLEPDMVIYPEDLEARDKKVGVRVESCDEVFMRIRTLPPPAEKWALDCAESFAGRPPAR